MPHERLVLHAPTKEYISVGLLAESSEHFLNGTSFCWITMDFQRILSFARFQPSIPLCRSISCLNRVLQAFLKMFISSNCLFLDNRFNFVLQIKPDNTKFDNGTNWNEPMYHKLNMWKGIMFQNQPQETDFFMLSFVKFHPQADTRPVRLGMNA